MFCIQHIKTLYALVVPAFDFLCNPPARMMSMLGKVMKPRNAVMVIILLSILFVVGVFYTHVHMDIGSLPNIHVNDFGNREASSLRGNHFFEADTLHEHSDQAPGLEDEKDKPSSDIDAIEKMKADTLGKEKGPVVNSNSEAQTTSEVDSEHEHEHVHAELDLEAPPVPVPEEPEAEKSPDPEPAMLPDPVTSSSGGTAIEEVAAESNEAVTSAATKALVTEEVDENTKTPPPPLLDMHIRSFGSYHEADLFTALLPRNGAGARRECVAVEPTSFGLPLARQTGESGTDRDIEGMEMVRLVKRGFSEGQVFDSPMVPDALKFVGDAVARHLIVENLTVFVELSSYPDSAVTIAHAVASAYSNVTVVHVDSRPMSESVFPDLEVVDAADSRVCAEDVSVVLRPDPANLYLVQDHSALFEAASVINGVQFVDNWGDFVNKQLPFEYETTVRDMLCRARYSYVPATFAASGSEEYFSYWSSLSELIERANAADADGNAHCLLTLDATSEPNQYLKKHGGQAYAVVERAYTSGASGLSVGKLLTARPTNAQIHKLMAMAVGSPAADVPAAAWSAISGEALRELAQSWLDAFVIVKGTEIAIDAVKLDSALALALAEPKNSIPAPEDSHSQHKSHSSFSTHKSGSDYSANSAHSKSWWQSGRKLMGTYTLGSSGATISSSISSSSSSETAPSSSSYSGSSVSSSGYHSSSHSSGSSSGSSSSSSGSGSSSSSSKSSAASSFSDLHVELLSSLSSKRRSTYRKRLMSSPLAVQFDSSGGSVDRGSADLNHFITEDKGGEEGQYWLDWPSADAVEEHMRAHKYASATSSSGIAIDHDMRLQQQVMQRREAASYAHWMKVLKSSFGADAAASSGGHVVRPIDDITKGRLVYMAGRDVSLLSIKAARMMKAQHEVGWKKSGAGADSSLGLVVSLLSDPSAAGAHEYLLGAMSVPNNILCSAQLHLSQLDAWSRAPERGAVALFQLDVVMRMYVMALADSGPLGVDGVCGAFNAQLEKLFAVLLSSADVVYFEMPTAERLQSMLAAYLAVGTLPERVRSALTCAGYLRKNDLVNASASAVIVSGLVERSISRLSLSSSQNRATRQPTYRLMELETQDPVLNGGRAAGSAIYRLEHVHHGQEEVPGSVVHSGKVRDQGVSVYTLLHLGVLPNFKRKMLKMLVEFPVRSYQRSAAGVDKEEILSKLLPWTLFVDTDTVGGGVSTPKSKRSAKMDVAASYGLHLRYRDSSSASDHGSASKTALGVSIRSRGGGGGPDSFSSEQREANLVFSILMNEFNNHRGELAGGKFSFVEHSSGQGFLSMLLAARFPNSTLVSMEDDYLSVRRHEFMLESLNITNNYVAHTSSSSYGSSSSRSKILKNLYDSPELFRFQVVSKGLIEAAETAHDSGAGDNIGNDVGTLLSLALTSFVRVPSASQVSWSMSTLYNTGVLDGLRWSDGSEEVDNNILRGTAGLISLAPVRPHASASMKEGADDKVADVYNLKSHPATGFEEFESYWLLGGVKLPKSSGTDGGTKVAITPLWLQGQRVPWVRCDIVNMTRHVHHHYDYAKDGHQRTYTMHVGVNHTVSQSVNSLINNHDPSEMISVQHPNGILLYSKALFAQHAGDAPGDVAYRTVYPPETLLTIPEKDLASLSEQELALRREEMSEKLREDVSRRASAQYPLLLPPGLHPNQHQITAVHLHRDRDDFPIPYTSVYGITLITALRLGIVSSQIERLYERFLKLPLYEDMAPWNIVLMGSSVDYIDYDTRDMVFDWDIPKAYQIMTVLMNYKRTVEDFTHCGSKASTVYGLPYVSDCVGSTSKSSSSRTMPKSCPDLKKPVPCGDGECHSDYISCLRSFADLSAHASNEEENTQGSAPMSKSLTIAEAIRSGIATFNDKGLL